MTRKQVLIGLICAGALGIGIVGVVEPAVLFDTVPELHSIISAVEPSLVLLGLVALLAVFTLARGVSGREQANPPSALYTTEQQTSLFDSYDYEVVGAALDSRLEAAMAYDDGDRSKRERARNDVETELRALATANYMERTGCEESVASERVEAGEWTDDPRAAAFLAGDTGPTTPLRLWLLDLLTGRDTFERGVEHTIDVIERSQSDHQEVAS